MGSQPSGRLFENNRYLRNFNRAREVLMLEFTQFPGGFVTLNPGTVLPFTGSSFCKTLYTQRQQTWAIKRRHRSPWTLQISTSGTDPNEDSTNQGEGQEQNSRRSPAQEELLRRFGEINLDEDEKGIYAVPEKPLYERRKGTFLQYLFSDFGRDTSQRIEDYLRPPIRRLTAGAFAIVFGFFAATAASTIIGSVADWDPLAAAVLLIWTESFTRAYYKTKEKSQLLRLLNAFKIGVTYGMVVDAFKLST